MFSAVISFNNCENPTVVARVGNHIIPGKDFRESFLDDKSIHQARKMSIDKKLDHLNGMIESQLLWTEAYKNKLDQKTSVGRVLVEYEKRLTLQKVVEKEIINKVITRRKIKEHYNRSLREAKLKHILLKINNNATVSQKNTLKNKMFDLRHSLLRGKSFESFAREFSEDSLSSGKGGDLGYVGWGAFNFGDSFYEKVFELIEGTVSRPILSSLGYHLVKVEKYRPTGKAAFKFESENIKQELINLHREKLTGTYFKFYEKCKKHYAFTFIDENIEYLSKQNNNKRKGLDKYNLPNFTMEEKARPLAQYTGGSYTLGRFILDVSKIPSYKRPPLIDSLTVKKFIDNMLVKELLTIWGFEKRFNNNRDLKKELLQKKQELMVSEIRKVKMAEMDEIETKELEEYFYSNKEKYKEAEQYKVREILVDNLVDAKKLITLLKTKPFEELAEKYNTRATTKGNKGLLGFITKNQYGNIGTAASSLEIGQISEPIKSGNKYSVIKVVDKRPEKELPFDAVKDKIKVDLQRLKTANYMSEWINMLKTNTIIAVYESQLTRVLN